MTLETAIKVMKYNKDLLGLPNNQGNTWSSNANTVACDIAIEVMEKELVEEQKRISELELKNKDKFI